jgi:hypothetical protein
MKKICLTLTLLGMLAGATFAQNQLDALRYSRLNPSGTARFVAMGGAFGALGSDFSALSVNPGGIGLYRSSEFSITPSFSTTTTESKLNGNFREDSRYNFNLGNVGIIMTNNPGLKNPNSPWKNMQFAFGLNRLANFNNRVQMNSNNNVSSYLSSYPGMANGQSPNALGRFDTYLAYSTDLLFVTDSATWAYGVDLPYGGVNQRKTIESKGSMNEMIFTFGGNYNDRLYIGATLGVPFIRYEEVATYAESKLEGEGTVFKNLKRVDNLETTGTGINFKFGMIVRATNWLRLGGAVHTPTFFSSMSDTYSSSLTSGFENGYTATESADGYFEYELNTPFRAIGSLGFVIGKSGIISADYEFVDYQTARLRSREYDFYNENESIRDQFQKTNNLRLGTEWRYGGLSFRGGYAFQDNPYKSGVNSALTSYSFGLGVREENFYVDLAWVHSYYDDEYYMYSGLVNPAYTTTTNNSFLLTLGFRY